MHFLFLDIQFFKTTSAFISQGAAASVGRVPNKWNRRSTLYVPEEQPAPKKKKKKNLDHISQQDLCHAGQVSAMFSFYLFHNRK